MPFAANFPSLPSDPRTGRALLLAQVGGLAATGWLVGVNAIAPRLARESLVSIAARASFYVLLTWTLSALVTLLIYAAIAGDESPRDVSDISLRTSAVAAWFAPAIILLSTLSPAGLVAGLLIVVNVSRLLILGWIPARIAEPAQTTPWNPLPAVGAALFLQGGIVLLIWKWPLPAAACFAMGTAIVAALGVMRSGVKQEKPRSMPPSSMSIALTILMAAAFSTASLKFREYASRGDGGSEGASRAAAPADPVDLSDPDMSFAVSGSGGFPGVILRPASRPESMPLMAPRPGLLKQSEKMTRPAEIPFTGEYWMYQPPLIRPPRKSIVRQGTPLELSFHTTSGATMQMEARQKLPYAVALKCCSGMDVNVSQRGALADLWLRVTLSDSVSRRLVELGAAQVSKEGAQFLHFSIPGGAGDRFDEIRVVYMRPRAAASRSANLAIEGFVLMPR